MTKLCSACGEEPRWRMANGQLSKMCEGCHKDDAENRLASMPKRQCISCHQAKPSEAFRKGGKVCIACKSAAAKAVSAKKAGRCKSAAAKAVSAKKAGRGPAPLYGEYPADEPPPPPVQQRVLLIDHARGQVILATIQSEIPAQARHIEMIADFYRGQGCRIIDSLERIAEGSK